MPTKGITVAQSNEHLRNFSAEAYRRKLSYAFDPTREHLNFEVRKGGVIVPVDKQLSIPKRIKDNLKARNIIDPNLGLPEPKYRTVANFILGGSRDQMHRLAFGEQQVNLDKGADNSKITRSPEIEKWAVDMYKFMSKKYGEKNIAAFIVHLDETNPHIHCTILPITERNKFSWKKVLSGADKFEYRDRMLKLHDELAEVNKKYQLERGDDISRTKAKHRTTEEYHQWRQKELRDDVIAKQSELRLVDEKLSATSAALKRAETKLKGLTTMIKNLEAVHSIKEKEMDALQKRLESGTGDINDIMERMDRLHAELKNIEDKINDKREKLSSAEHEIENLLAVKEEKEKTNILLEEKNTQLETNIQKNVDNLQEREIKNMSSIALDYLNTERKEQVQKAAEYESGLSEHEKKIIDNYNKNVFGGTLAEDAAVKTNEVVAVAAALYFGYIDQAIKFASTGDGGGGGNQDLSGWGRKDDEDEWAWRKRCFGMALHLMKTGKKKNMRR